MRGVQRTPRAELVHGVVQLVTLGGQGSKSGSQGSSGQGGNGSQNGGGSQSGPGTFNLTAGQNGVLLSPTIAPFTLVPGSTTGNAFTGIQTGGVTVSATDYNRDGLDDIVVGAGSGNAPRVRVFNIKNQAEIINLLPFSATFLGGVNVAASTTNLTNIAQPQ